MMTQCQKYLVFTYLICQLILNLSKLYGQHSWISFSLKIIRNEFFNSPSTLSVLRSSHTLPSFSSRSVVERGGGDEEPGSKGIQNFSKFSLLLYTEKITTVIPVQTANYSHVKVKQSQFSIITPMIIVENNYYVFLLHTNSIPSLAKVENETMPNLD